MWHDEGENNILNAYFKDTGRPANSWYIGLYQDANALGESDGLGDITELAEANGYARELIDDANWTVANDAADGMQVTFTANGAAWSDIYGWFLTDCANGTAGNLLASEHFSGGPYNVPDGGSLKLTPTVTAA